VVGDVRVRGLEQTSEPQVYLPAGQVVDNSLIGYIPQDLVIHSTVPIDVAAVRRIVTSIDPEQPISNVQSLSEIVADGTAPRRVQLRVLMILAAVALLIAGVGIHGLLSFAVSQRTRELGIRSALGAEARSIVAMILREGLTLALLGTVIGIGVALFAGRAMRALLFGIPTHDPQTILAAITLCLLTALIGCLYPAFRAARVDPMTALREG
jgi:ABC-type antimicrobial peptide transport system permease subunit